MNKYMRSTLLLIITSACVGIAHPIPAVFVEGLFLPSTEKSYTTTDATTQLLLTEHHKHQTLISFLLKQDAESTSVWGITGKVVTAEQPGAGNKLTHPLFTLKTIDIIQVYNPALNIQEFETTLSSGTKVITHEVTNNAYATYKDSAIFNKLPKQNVDEIINIIHRRYKTAAFKKEVNNIQSCNQFITTVADRLNLEVTTTKAIEFITQNFSIKPKLTLLVELIINQNKSFQSTGEEDDQSSDIFREQLISLNLEEEANTYLHEQIDNYEKNKSNPHVGPVLESYLKLALSLPWKDSMATGPEQFDLEQVAATLDEYQFGMEQVKDIVITHLALRMVSNNTTPFVLCLVGKPGTGKTSICQHIANALNKKMYRLSLGGVHTQSDITGHSRSYVNASEGKIIKALKTTGSASCLILLDEIDKLGTQNQFHGSPADALLHALDPEQNNRFYDDYLGTPFNLSRVLFIATANNESEIPQALRDRMIVVQVPSYSRAEKIEIARTKILPRLFSNVGLMSKKPFFSDATIGAVIDKYTFEDGLRGLTNQLNLLIGKFARAYLRNEEIIFSPENLEFYLGSEHNNLAEFKRKAKVIEHFLTPDNRKRLFDAIDSLDGTKQRTQEYEHLRTYIATFLSLPWAPATDTTNYDLTAVSQAIDATHYGADDIKENILDYLALSQRLTKSSLGTTLCLHGPPGVGKTSIAQALATALNKKMARISMSGVASPYDLRGLAPEYSGSHLGAIAKALSEAGSTNTVIVLDEIDKIPNELVANTLLDILDPSQNNAFVDNYIGGPIDLSRVLFIATANKLETIPYPILNRMTLIEMDAYSVRQKVEIAQNYIIPKLLVEYNLTSLPFITTELITEIILHYTYEAGVRDLTRQLKTLVARSLRMHQLNTPGYVTPETLPLYLGAPFQRDAHPTEDKVGVVNGLSFSAAGGNLITIEVQSYPGKGEVKSTGLLGEMFKESIQQAMTYIKANAGSITERFIPAERRAAFTAFDSTDIHLQIRPMNVEGPSAGLALCTGIISALSGRPVRHDYAMTGEIDVLGNAHVIGGINQKFENARRNGIKYIILPEENRADFNVLREKPEGVEFIFVKHINEVLERVLLPA